MSFYWLTDPELFLYAKGTGPDDVLLRRCKKPASSSSSSLVVPMKSDDFDFVKIVKNHLELIGYMFDWDEPDYKRLVKYIYEKRLLVNSQGFVIAELLHKVDKDGNKTIDDANEEEEVPAIYIRSLDVLPLKPYIPILRERPIPSRTVKYLGDVNGKAVPMEEDSNVTKLTARVDDLEGKVTKLTADQVAMTDKDNDLESRNKTLEGKVTKLTADLTTQMNALTTLQRQANQEVWMKDLTNNEWAGIERLVADDKPYYDNLIIIGGQGTFTADRVHSQWMTILPTFGPDIRYWYKINIWAGSSEYKAISLEDLTPHKEKARFSRMHWVRPLYQKEKLICTGTSSH